MGIDYAQEKATQAVLEFLGEGPLRQRLQYAGETLLRLEGRDFPPQFKKRFQGMRDLLTERGPGAEGRGSVEHTAMGMSDQQVTEASERILLFFADVHAVAETLDYESTHRSEGGQE